MDQNITFVSLIFTIFDIFAYILFGFVIILLLSHFICRLRKIPSLQLLESSFVIITGGCMGLGKQMALQIAKKYHSSILIVDYQKNLFQQVSKQIVQLGSTVQFFYCDLSNQESVQEFISYIKRRNQNINLFIHNAGIHIPKRALQTSQKQFIMQFRVNFMSPVKIIRQTIQFMENGHIGIIASVVALVHGGINMSTYSSTKYALYSYVNSLRQQFKSDKKNITISMGCPYLIRTTMFQGFRTKLDLIFRTLDPKYVAKRLVKQFIQKKQICYVYQYQAVLFKIVNLFPTYLLDLLSIKFNISNFEKIKGKYDQKIKKMK